MAFPVRPLQRPFSGLSAGFSHGQDHLFSNSWRTSSRPCGPRCGAANPARPNGLPPPHQDPWGLRRLGGMGVKVPVPLSFWNLDQIGTVFLAKFWRSVHLIADLDPALILRGYHHSVSPLKPHPGNKTTSAIPRSRPLMTPLIGTQVGRVHKAASIRRSGVRRLSPISPEAAPPRTGRIARYS
jgi:hypothetical protein